MAYTKTDLANVKAAILALSTGERAVSVSFGDKQFRYSEVDLDQLRKLRAEIQSELRAASGRGRYVLIQTSKGL